MKTQQLLLRGALCLLLLGLSRGGAVPRRQRESADEKKMIAIKALVELLTEDGGAAAGAGDAKKPEGEQESELAALMKDLASAVRNNTKALLTTMEEKEELQCAPPFFAAGGECFYVNNRKRLTWVEAQTFCRGLGGDLAEPDRVNMLRAVLLQKYPADENQFFWVGASVNGTGKAWKWVSGRNVSRGDWGTDQPDGGNENCVVLSRDEFPALHDSPCYTQTMFICEKAVVIPN